LRAWFVFELWSKYDIKVVANANYNRITNQGLVVLDRDGKERLIEADTVVFSMGLEQEKTLSEKIKGQVKEIYEVGDCIEPRKIIDAMREGAQAGRQI